MAAAPGGKTGDVLLLPIIGRRVWENLLDLPVKYGKIGTLLPGGDLRVMRTERDAGDGCCGRGRLH